MDSYYSDHPLNFAHRGASYEAPENTIAAFLLAVELGADGIELDVQLSKDGEVVVIHDVSVDTTTDGHGPVAAKTLAELQELDAGSWFDPIYAGQQILTLQQVVEAVGQRLLLNIELKTAKLMDGELVKAVVHIVEENHLLDRVVVSSFNHLVLRKVRQLNPWIPIGLLYSPDMPLPLRRTWLRPLLRPEALHPSYEMLDPETVHWAKERGYRIHTWTVDDPGTMWQIMRMGVDLIITNRPDLLSEVLRTRSGRQAPTARPTAPSPSRTGG
jgi:glycerophosphoryl diester phosphodiesterase